MTIGIIVAMEKELQLLLPLLEERSDLIIRNRHLYIGKIGRHDVALMKCGIGKVNSAISTLTLIEETSPDMIINTGVAGGTDSSMHVMDLLVATEVAYHDVWCGPGTEYGAAAGCEKIFVPDGTLISLARERLKGDKVKYGMICSGDKFISEASEVAEIKSRFPQSLACDMESASIAQVCSLKGVRFNIVRVISDTPGEPESIALYENFWQDAPLETFNSLRILLE